MTMNKNLLFAALAVAVAGLGTAMPAHALFGDDEARKAILDMRERMTSLQNAQLMLQGQIDQLREENARLTGTVEQLANQVAVLQRSNKTLYTDLEQRLAPIEAQEIQIEGQSVKVSAEEKRQYDQAMACFADEDYKCTETMLLNLNKVYPDSALRSEVLFWLGTTYYAQDSLKNSISTIDMLAREFPKSKRLPDALLTKAAALAGQNRRNDSAALLRSIIKQYAGTPAAELAQERLKTLQRGGRQKK